MKEAKAQSALKLALEFVASISPAFICEATHHKKNEEHASNEPCPHVKKQKQTYETIKEALASPIIKSYLEKDNSEEALANHMEDNLTMVAQPVAWLHTKIEGVAVPHRPADLDKHPDRWTALYKDPPPCPTCEALARTVMMDQTGRDA